MVVTIFVHTNSAPTKRKRNKTKSCMAYNIYKHIIENKRKEERHRQNNSTDRRLSLTERYCFAIP